MEKIVIDVILGIKIGFFRWNFQFFNVLSNFMISNKIYYNLSKIYQVKWLGRGWLKKKRVEF